MRRRILLLIALIFTVTAAGCMKQITAPVKDTVPSDAELSGVKTKNIEAAAKKLIEQNYESFAKIFYLQTLPVEAENGIIGTGIYPVKSDKFKTYADLENFVRDTYVKKEADYLLTNFTGTGPQYINREGKLYTDKSKEGGIGYYKEWENYKYELQDIKEESAIISILLKEEEICTDPILKKDIYLTMNMIKENGKWLLEKMVY